MSKASAFLSPAFLDQYKGKRPKNAGVLFEVTYLNKYAWWIEEEKRRERWDEVIERVVNYSLSLYQGPASSEELEKEAELMFKKGFELEAFPAGRTLRIGGTPACYKFPEMNFNCFKASEKFLTSEGYRSFDSFEDGSKVNVMVKQGSYREATVRRFGKEEIVELTLKKGKTTKIISTTANHRWLIRDYSYNYHTSEKTTDTLEKGQLIPEVRNPLSWKNIKPCSVGIQHGIVFGDGTFAKNIGSCQIALQDDSQELVSYFNTGVILNNGAKGGKILNQTVITGLPFNWKELPSLKANKEYLLGFLMGWFSADGSTSSESAVLASSNEDNLEWAKSALALVGIYTTKIRLSRAIRPFDGSDKPLYSLWIPRQYLTKNFFIRSKSKNDFIQGKKELESWTVESVVHTGKYEEVWCVQEPETETFVLEDGILTKNCAFISLQHELDLVDLFHMSLCSVGIGFRVLPRDIVKFSRLANIVWVENETPNYNQTNYESTKTEFLGYQGIFPVYKITVGDSKEGWVKSLETFLTYTASYDHIKWIINYDNVRPEGQRIKTAGGYAAGPEGLMEMFKRLAEIITHNNGILTPTSVMDVANIIAKNVVTGGNRRAAQIALGSPYDNEFVSAKFNLYTIDELTGKYNIDPKLEHRKMSNNSLVFEQKPSLEELTKIFEYIKNNGEPGFFNLDAARKRRPNCEGLNPCLTKDSWISTSKGPRQIKELLQTDFKALINNETKTATPFWSSGVKKVYTLNTVEGFQLKLTADHKVLTEKGWKEARYLTTEDEIVLNKTINNEWDGEGTYKEGWLLGSLVGDGTFGYTEGNLRFWGKDKHLMAEKALEFMSDSVKHRSDCAVVDHPTNNYSEIGSVGIAKLASKFGLVRGNKVYISEQIEKASSEFYAGYLQGLFDADGSVQGSVKKGRSIRLTQADLEFLRGIQRMLLRLGIKSTLYEERREEGLRSLPNGKGGYSEYKCKSIHELIISRVDMGTFLLRIGFSEPDKFDLLRQFVFESKRQLYANKFTARFKSLEYFGEEEVFDCSVADLHRFDANGLIVHNCAEILLDSKGVCNLSTVNMVAHIMNYPNNRHVFDTKKLEESVRLATRIGLRQTNVTLSLPKWDEIQKRDRLIGPSFTGWMDAVEIIIGDEDPITWKRYFDNILLKMSCWANEEADKYAFEMRVPRPLLVCAVKPEGTISQLPTVSSGLHKAFAPHYIRRMTVNKTDSLNKVLKILGVQWEEDVRSSGSSRDIFLFPVKTEAKQSAYDEPALKQFDRYRQMQALYSDHNSSITIYVGEDEWEDLVKEVYEHWDEVIAISFLRKYDIWGKPPYPQMPYEAITEERYNKMKSSINNLDLVYDYLINIETEKVEYVESSDGCESGICPTA